MKWLLTFIFGSVLALAASKEDSGTPLDYNDDNQASAALLFLDLHNQGLVGGKTGICLDLTYDGDGRPQYKVAFDTEAFTTGDSKFKPGAMNLEGFKKLMDGLSRAQGGKKIPISIEGYADPQHYQSVMPDVNKSVQKNQDLSLARANTVAEILKTDPKLSEFLGEVKTKGFASPDLEKKFAGDKTGLKCPTRRKVVITLNQPTPQFKSEVAGSFFRAPESMSGQTKNAISIEYNKNQNQAITSLAKSSKISIKRNPSETDVNLVFKTLKDTHKINSECEKPPFKQIALALIHQKIAKKAGKDLSKIGLMQQYLKTSGFKIKDLQGGASALEKSCLVPSDGLIQSMQTQVKDYAVSGGTFLGQSKTRPIQSGIREETDGGVKIGFDVNSLNEEVIPSGKNKGQKLKAFYCRACGSGLFFHTHADGSYDTEYVDRVVKFDSQAGSTDQKRFLSNLDQLSKSDPFSIGSFIKPRLYVVKDCANCTCNHTQRIRDAAANPADASVLSFDPISSGSTTQKLSKSEFSQACIIRPPVYHACSVDPNDNSGNDETKMSETFTYVSVINQGLTSTGKTIEELITHVSNSCPGVTNPKIMTPEEKINDAMCSSDDKKRLPTEDEMADCEEYLSSAAK